MNDIYIECTFPGNEFTYTYLCDVELAPMKGDWAVVEQKETAYKPPFVVVQVHRCCVDKPKGSFEIKRVNHIISDLV